MAALSALRDPRLVDPDPPIGRASPGEVTRPGEDMLPFASILRLDPLRDGTLLVDLRDALGGPGGDHFRRATWWFVVLYARASEAVPGQQLDIVRRWLVKVLCERANDRAWADRCREPARRAAQALMPGVDIEGFARLVAPFDCDSPAAQAAPQGETMRVFVDMKRFSIGPRVVDCSRWGVRWDDFIALVRRRVSAPGPKGGAMRLKAGRVDDLRKDLGHLLAFTGTKDTYRLAVVPEVVEGERGGAQGERAPVAPRKPLRGPKSGR